MNTNTQIVSPQSLGWIGVAGIAAIFASLVITWTVNDKYSFLAQQMQFIIQQQNQTIQEYKADKKRMEDRVMLLELQIKER